MKNNLSAHVILTAVAVFSFQNAGLCQESGSKTGADETKDKPQPILLQGGVKHKERLDPVPPYLMSGAKFDAEAAPKLTAGNNWIPVPDWLAGTWQFKTENVTAMVNYTKEDYTQPPYTIRNEAQKVFGQQKDKTGHPWHYLKAPYSYISKLNHGTSGYERITSTEPIVADENLVFLKIIGTSTQVKKEKVLDTDQAEDFNRYTPLGNDQMILNGSAKHFDMDGTPTMDMTSNMIAHRIKPFVVVDEQDGENLKQLFTDFLKSHGKEELVP